MNDIIFYGILIIIGIIITGLYIKMIFIWRDVMLKQNDQWYKDSCKIKDSKSIPQPPKARTIISNK